MGRFENAVLSLFTKRARVTALRSVAERFELVALQGDALRGVEWVPGQKVQLQFGGFTQRTFTPIAWDPVAGTTELLVFVHGDGPVRRWVQSLEVGAPCSIFGPRASLDLTAAERPLLVSGDETSFGLAHALRHTPSGAKDATLLLEVTSLSAAERALEALGLENARLVERRAGDAHLETLEEAALTAVRERSLRGAVLSGKATTIQRLNRRLKSLGSARPRIATKAYWAPGKTGLD